jgi:hypothetical protein
MSAADKAKLDGAATIVSSVTGTAPVAVATGTSTPVVSITPGTARQLLQTNAGATAVEFASNIDVPGTLDVTGVGTFDGDLKFNSGYGSAATAYGCRAWVNFDGTGASAVIRASGNVSSVTKNGTGDYTVNFTTAMADVNYSVSSSVGTAGADYRVSMPNFSTPPATTSFQVVTGTYFNNGSVGSSPGLNFDIQYVNAAVFR